MTAILARIAISLITKLITETFLSKLLIEGCRAWSKSTANTYDDRVVEAMAQSLGVCPVELKEAVKQAGQ